MIYCIIQQPTDKLENDLVKYWPKEYLYFKDNGDIIVTVTEVFTDDLGPNKRLYLTLTKDQFKCSMHVPYDTFYNYQRRINL